MKITAYQVQELLKKKHAKDVYVSECKTGPSYAGHMRLDGWAMKKSWAHPMVTGYEIKVSRSDFLQDDKYLGYRAYCNCLFLVAPKDVVKIEEVPEGVGLYTVASTGNRLFCKRKAATRDEPLPEELYRYILMARAKILTSNQAWALAKTGAEYWEKWLEEKEINSAMGHRVSRELRIAIDKKIDGVHRENERLKRQNENLEETKKILEKLGLDRMPMWNAEDRFKSEYEKRINGQRMEIESSIDQAMKSLEALKAAI